MNNGHQLESVSTEALAHFEHFIRFVSVDPVKNRARFYLLTWQPTLQGGGALVCTWGRLGTQGRSLAVFYNDRASAQVKIARALKRRFKRGYQLAEWQ